MQEVFEKMRLQRGNGKSDPLYKQVSTLVRNGIQTGKLAVGDRLPSFSEMSNALKVDHRTLKAAIKLLEKDGLLRIEAGRKHGPVILKKVDNKKYTIAFVRWIRNSLDLQITEGIKKFAEDQGLQCAIMDVADPHDSASFLEMLSTIHVDGLLVIPQSTRNRKDIIKAISGTTDLVLIDRTIDGMDVSSVSVDHISGAYKATKHLLENHRQPVYFLCYGSSVSSSQERLRGWATAMNEHGFDSLEKFIWDISKEESELTFSMADLNIQEQYHSISRSASVFLNRIRSESYSVFCINDFVAKGVYIAAEKKGLKVGEDVFVVGFGDYPLCEQLSPTLTSVYQENQKVGYEAAKLLYMSMVGSLKKAIHWRLPAELCIRESSVLKKVEGAHSK